MIKNIEEWRKYKINEIDVRNVENRFNISI